MNFESLESMAHTRHLLHVAILLSLLGAFLVPWVAAIADEIKASRKHSKLRNLNK